ncbi:hypothetical protein GCM10009416_35700 [Craurococcus roseus]|uniref:Hyalin n=1 Tax=Craurococcus roseus TaxID=77585 RepID=A0ABP3QRA5_9PROT
MDIAVDLGAAALQAPAEAHTAGRGGEWAAPHAIPVPADRDALAEAIRRILEGKHAPPFPAPSPPPDDRFVFSAEDGSNGRELWVTDGTAEGTSLVRDINPGAGDAFPFSFPGSFGALGDGRALFGADDGSGGGVELWITDGTGAGTRLVEDLTTGPFGGDPRSFLPLGDGRALFAAGDAAFGRSLWVSDGTAEGTRLVSPQTNGRSYIESDFGLLREGEALVGSFDAGSYVVLRTDGTEAGTRSIKDFGSAEFSPFGLYPLGDGRLLFRAEEAGSGAGAELWISDGTEAGTRLVKDLNPGEGASFPAAYHALGDGRALFGAFGGTAANGLWITDGTEAGTAFLADVRPVLGPGGVAGAFADLGDGRALFLGSDTANGTELWVTNGTAAGTRLVEDINPGRDSGAFGIAPLGAGRVLLIGFDGATGIEPWISDGTAEGTRLLKDVRPGTGPGSSSDAGGLAPFANGARALFGANDGFHGREVWITDGTGDGTRLVEDLRPGAEGSAPGQFVSLGAGDGGRGGMHWHWFDPFG